MSVFKCDLCLEEFTEQFVFFGHLKAHYDIGVGREVSSPSSQVSCTKDTGPSTTLESPRSRLPPKELDSVTAVIEEVIEQVGGDADDTVTCKPEFEEERKYLAHSSSCKVDLPGENGEPAMHYHSILDYKVRRVSNFQDSISCYK